MRADHLSFLKEGKSFLGRRVPRTAASGGVVGRNGELFLSASIYCTHIPRLPAAHKRAFAHAGVCCVGECPEVIICSLTHPTNI